MITQSCSSKAHSARRLPPAAFDEDVSIVPALPPGGHPHGMFTGRNVPSSRLPDICSTVPAVIPGDPDVPPARSVRAVLVNADRRAQLYHYLRSLGRSYPQGNPNERVHKKFPHRRILLKGYGEHAHGRSGCEARQHSRRRADGRSRPAVAWPPPTAQRVGGRLARQDWFGRAAGSGAGQRSEKPAPPYAAGREGAGDIADFQAAYQAGGEPWSGRLLGRQQGQRDGNRREGEEEGALHRFCARVYRRVARGSRIMGLRWASMKHC